MVKRLSPEDEALWRAAMRDAAPLKGKALPPAPPLETARPGAALPPLARGRAAGVDRRSVERLSRGRTPVEATLDLHGMTQAEAHRRLADFLARSADAGRRCVLVVTGKGLSKSEGGVLKAAVPRWLNEAPLRGEVLAYDYAAPRHGGMGALYVLLKRRRPR